MSNSQNTYNFINNTLGGFGEEMPKTEEEWKELQNLLKKCIKLLDEQRTGKNNNDVVKIY